MAAKVIESKNWSFEVATGFCRQFGIMLDWFIQPKRKYYVRRGGKSLHTSPRTAHVCLSLPFSYISLDLLEIVPDRLKKLLTMDEAAIRLGLSKNHIDRLIENGLIKAENGGILLESIIDFEERREEASRKAGEWSRLLNELGAPLE